MSDLKECPFDAAEKALTVLANTEMQLNFYQWSDVCNAILSAINKGRELSAPNTLVITRAELEGMIRKPADYTPTSKKEIQLVRHGRNALIDELLERIKG